ncbi:polyamine-modulated factor 1 [Austrofundulus limnaeus]|uniref:Polyamine-modulated factor 1 n=1 Tax=Austrofundulus limnaeus TaxID=52670 RepID=A0A2I4B3L5_AUSLI|nr:PREDICTED: polyamine-modulated factor 1-like [Austrofundulus limnaeus]
MKETSVSAPDEMAKTSESGSSEKERAEENPAEASNQDAAGKPTEEASERIKLFDKVMQKSLNNFMEQASFKGFSSMFRPLYKMNPRIMESIHKQFTEELRKTIQEDITKLIEEGELSFKLNEIDKLEAAAKDDPEPAWRPSGVPERDFCSFLIPYYQKQEGYVARELKKIQAENATLAKKVQAGRESIAQTELRISTAVEDWKASVAEFEKVSSSFHSAVV